jgi:hypothetical protein
MGWLTISVPSIPRLVVNSVTSLMSWIDCDIILRHVNN